MNAVLSDNIQPIYNNFYTKEDKQDILRVLKENKIPPTETNYLLLRSIHFQREWENFRLLIMGCKDYYKAPFILYESGEMCIDSAPTHATIHTDLLTAVHQAIPKEGYTLVSEKNGHFFVHSEKKINGVLKRKVSSVVMVSPMFVGEFYVGCANKGPQETIIKFYNKRFYNPLYITNRESYRRFSEFNNTYEGCIKYMA